MLLIVMSVASCAATPRVLCDYPATADMIVGRLLARRGVTATFEVTSVTPGASSPGSRSKPPAIVKGQRLTVRYYGSQAQYLRVGREYRVELWWLSNQFQPGVHVASDACSTGTTYADGSAINTSASTASPVRAIGVGLLFVALVAVTTPLLRGRRRRRRRGTPRVSGCGSR